MSTANQGLRKNDILETRSPEFSVEQVKEFAHDLFGLKGKLSPLESERDQNFRIITKSGEEYVIKIANRAEDLAVIDMQLNALEHIAVVDPDLPVPEVLLSQNGLAIEQIQDEKGNKHHVRVITFLHGAHPADNPSENALLRPMGSCLARLALALRGFFHPAADYGLLYDLKHTSKLRQYLPHVTDEEHSDLVTYFLDRFDKNVLPRIPKLRAQIVHNDLVPDNILVAENDPGRIVGIIDFGDLTHTLLIGDLATTVARMLYGHSDLIQAAAEIVAGYNEIISLEDAELSILYDLVAARLTMLAVIASWRVTIHPYNREYIIGNVEETWQTLARWRELDAAVAASKFFRVCGFWELEEDYLKPNVSGETFQSHLKRRNSLLGQSTYLFYKHPLHIVRGEGVWLYDSAGNRFLDAYNNVPHVGHCHPHVVKAIANQAKQLNTSTRYMHGLILELAEKITETLPEPLSVCMFVCTGSEANELAWQMSKIVSGNHGALITRFSYHGSTAATTQFSTETIPIEKLLSHVRTLSAPTSNTGFEGTDSGISYAIEELGKQGHNPAMLIFDSGFVSDGIYTSPKGYLSTIYAKTRAVGGLCVADEVQTGFGRFGKHFWGFQFDGVIPDIVTIGKPMGNGHPIAAVVTRPEIAAALAAEMGYFNTFGGNPVSCAAGLAVLEVIEKEGLQQNALDVGQYLIKRLEQIQEDYPVIGELHGAGLLLGVDIIKSDGTPDSETADRIWNQMREAGVLIGTTGRRFSILKIRPPIVFQKEHADILLETLTNALDEL